jgi:hypothetical protein
MTTPLLDTLTAWPMLRLLLAMDGMEPPQLPARRCWTVFKAYLALPSASERDVAAFQSNWILEDPASPIFVVRLVRQLTDNASGVGQFTRSVELQWFYEMPHDPSLAERDLWSEDFHGIEGFAAAVEALPEWAFAVENKASEGDLLEAEE